MAKLHHYTWAAWVGSQPGYCLCKLTSLMPNLGCTIGKSCSFPSTKLISMVGCWFNHHRGCLTSSAWHSYRKKTDPITNTGIACVNAGYSQLWVDQEALTTLLKLWCTRLTWLLVEYLLQKHPNLGLLSRGYWFLAQGKMGRMAVWSFHILANGCVLILQ